MTESRLVDYHCHLDLYPQHNAVFDSCRDARLEVFTMTTTPRAWQGNLELAKAMPNIRVGLGLHPQLVGTKEADIDLFERLAPKAKFIGEVGLDAGPRFYKTMELQKELFGRVLQISAQTGPKILSLHAVRSVGLILPMLEEHLSGSGCQPIFHWFSGSVAEAKRAIALGCWFSINQEMRESKNGKRILAEIPLDRILTETDGPFTQIGSGVPATPHDVHLSAAFIAEVKQLDEDWVKETVLNNLVALEKRIA